MPFNYLTRIITVHSLSPDSQDCEDDPWEDVARKVVHLLCQEVGDLVGDQGAVPAVGGPVEHAIGSSSLAHVTHETSFLSHSVTMSLAK